MRRLFLLMAILITLLLLGCTNPTDNPQVYDLEGVVFDQADQPLAGARVKLNNGQQITTGVKGTWSLKVLRGSYTVTVSLTGYVTETFSIYVGSDTSRKVYLEPDGSSNSGAVAEGRVTFGYQSSAEVRQANFSAHPLSKTDVSEQEYQGLLVKFVDGVDEQQIQQMLTLAQPTLIRKNKSGVHTIQADGDLLELMHQLESQDSVEYVQPNYRRKLLANPVVPNDPLYQYQWNLEMINAPAAWSMAKGETSNVIVAVIDTGILYNNDLVKNLNILPGYDPVDDDFDPTDDAAQGGEASHGTHVTSIISALSNNNLGMSGVSWNLQVMPIKVFGSDGYAYDEDTIAGIRYAVDHGAKVINLSLGSKLNTQPSSNPAFEDALQYAYERGVSVIAAAGNDQLYYLNYPATSSYTLAVGAVGADGERTYYSNVGTGLDLMAPGGHGPDQGIWEYTDGILGYIDATNEPSLMVGTSMATPHVTAVAGLLSAKGVSTPAEIYAILKDTATPKGSTNEYGAGLLNAAAAIELASNGYVEPGPELTNTQIFAATLADGVFTQVSDIVYPDLAGDYRITGITEYGVPLYIVGLIDQDRNGDLSSGDYFGYTERGVEFGPGQTHTQLDFTIDRYEELSSLSQQSGGFQLLLKSPLTGQ